MIGKEDEKCLETEERRDTAIREEAVDDAVVTVAAETRPIRDARGGMGRAGLRDKLVVRWRARPRDFMAGSLHGRILYLLGYTLTKRGTLRIGQPDDDVCPRGVTNGRDDEMNNDCCGRTRGMCGQPLTNTFRAADTAPATCQALVGSGATLAYQFWELPSLTSALALKFIRCDRTVRAVPDGRKALQSEHRTNLHLGAS